MLILTIKPCLYSPYQLILQCVYINNEEISSLAFMIKVNKCIFFKLRT